MVFPVQGRIRNPVSRSIPPLFYFQVRTLKKQLRLQLINKLNVWFPGSGAGSRNPASRLLPSILPDPSKTSIRACCTLVMQTENSPDTALLVLASLAAPVVVREHPPDDVRGGVHVPQRKPHRRVVLQCLLYFQYTARRIPVLACGLQQRGLLYRNSN